MAVKALAVFVLFVELFGMLPIGAAFGFSTTGGSPVAPSMSDPNNVLLANGTVVTPGALSNMLATGAVPTNNYYYNAYHLSSCQQGGTFVLATINDPSPGIAGDELGQQALTIGAELFAPLVHLDPQGNPHPDLAESWTISPNGTVYTFHLVKNATWSDGVAVTAQDVYYTYMKIDPVLSPRYAAMSPYINKWVVIDNYTVAVVLNGPDPTFFWDLELLSFGNVLPMHMYDGAPGSNRTIAPGNIQETKPVSDGPFMFKEWVRGDHVTLVKNPNYFRAGEPVLDQVIFKIIPDANTRYAALAAGEVDALNAGTAANALQEMASPSQYPGIVQLRPVSNTFSAGWSFIQFNQRRPLFNGSNGLLVRQALAYSFPEAEVVSKAYLNLTAPAPNGPYTVGTYAYTPNAASYPFNLTKAAALLDQAGYKAKADGSRFSFTLSYRPSLHSEFASIGTIWAEQLSKIGVTLTMVPVSDANYITEVVGGPFNFDVLGSGGTAGPDYASTTLRYWTTSNILPGVVDVNSGDYSNPQLDALAAQAITAPTLAQQGQLLGQIEVIVMHDLPTLSLGGPSTLPTSQKADILNFKTTSAYDTYDNFMGITCFVKAATTTSATASTPLSSSTGTSLSTSAVQSPSTSSTTLLAAGIVAAVLVVAVGFAVVRSRRKPPTTATP